jgi:tetratricopeptide (TPR) repeat protein
MLNNTKRILSLGGVLVLSLLATMNCGTSRESVYGNQYVPRVSKPTTIPADTLKLWNNRHEKVDLVKAIEDLTALAEQNPGDYNLYLKLCNGHYLMADGHLYLELNSENEESIKAEQEKHFDSAVKWCERALGTNEQFYRAIESGVKFDLAIQSLSKSEVDALYWKYAALAKWSRIKGLMTLLDNKPSFTAINNRVQELDPNFFHAAVIRYNAAANFASPVGDKKAGHAQFAEAFKKSPNYFGGKVLYVDLGLRGDEEKAIKLLNEVIKGDPNKIPEIKSEQIIEQRKAKKLLEEEFS